MILGPLNMRGRSARRDLYAALNLGPSKRVEILNRLKICSLMNRDDFKTLPYTTENENF